MCGPAGHRKHEVKRNKHMNVKKMFVLGAGVALVAAGCSKAPQTQAPVPAATTKTTTSGVPAPAAELDPTKDWIRFYPGDNLKFNLLFPVAWWGDEGGTDTHFTLRSRKGADGSKADDAVLDFTIAQMTAKSLSDQVTVDIKGAKDVSPVITGLTDRGVPYAYAAFIDPAGKTASSFAVEYQGNQYIRIKVTGNVTFPYVGRMIQSISLIK
jgi:hypothetical protein